MDKMRLNRVQEIGCDTYFIYFSRVKMLGTLQRHNNENEEKTMATTEFTAGFRTLRKP